VDVYGVGRETHRAGCALCLPI